MNPKGTALAVLFLTLFVSDGLSHAASVNRKNFAPNVNFIDYGEEAFGSAKSDNKPIFILFFAHWCPWCKKFDENTLGDAAVYGYLNKYFVNVLVDVDLNKDLEAKYGVTMLPYVVVLRPDGELEYKYGGMLDSDGFLGFIKETRRKALQNSK